MHQDCCNHSKPEQGRKSDTDDEDEGAHDGRTFYDISVDQAVRAASVVPLAQPLTKDGKTGDAGSKQQQAGRLRHRDNLSRADDFRNWRGWVCRETRRPRPHKITQRSARGEMPPDGSAATNCPAADDDAGDLGYRPGSRRMRRAMRSPNAVKMASRPR